MLFSSSSSWPMSFPKDRLVCTSCKSKYSSSFAQILFGKQYIRWDFILIGVLQFSAPPLCVKMGIALWELNVKPMGSIWHIVCDQWMLLQTGQDKKYSIITSNFPNTSRFPMKPIRVFLLLLFSNTKERHGKVHFPKFSGFTPFRSIFMVFTVYWSKLLFMVDHTVWPTSEKWKLFLSIYELLLFSFTVC